MKLPDGKHVADLSPQEREEHEAAMQAHIDAYQGIADAIAKGIQGLQEAVQEAVENSAPGILEPILAIDQLAGGLMFIGQQLHQHAEEDARAFEDGLEGLERLGNQREKDQKVAKNLEDAGLGQIIRPRPDPEAEA